MKVSVVVCALVLMLMVQRCSSGILAGIGAATGSIIAGGSATGAAKQIIDLLHITYGRGVGRIPDKQPCPRGLRDDGTSCWSDAHIYGKECCCTIFSKWCCGNCRRGYHDDGCTCRKTDVGIKVNWFQRRYCRNNEDLYGGLCYPKCKEGYSAAGCCLCKKDNKK